MLKKILTLGERIKIIRENLNLNQVEFANKLGLKTSTAISYYETNQREPDITSLIKIAELSGLSLNWLLLGENLSEKEKIQNKNIIPEPSTEHRKDDNFTYVPLFDVHGSAGSGNNVEDEKIIDLLAFKTEWIKEELKVSPALLNVLF
ncbi:helix-turn-helix transcriptional regulator, partial [Candidatus Desantisbacteria bacterium]|nr:helix-turn-helix transcriptional regulator [Candidatus Desantisbacteria bacterium]